MQEMLEWVRATLPMDLDTPRLIEEKIESILDKDKNIKDEMLQIITEHDFELGKAPLIDKIINL